MVIILPRLASVKEITQLMTSARVAQLAERLCLDLADSLAGDAEVLSDLFQRAGPAVVKSEAQTEHLFFPRSQRVKHFLELLL